MSNDEKKFQPIFQILHIKSAWFFLELAMALVTTIGMRFLQVCTCRLPGKTEHLHFTVYIYKEDISKVCY